MNFMPLRVPQNLKLPTWRPEKHRDTLGHLCNLFEVVPVPRGPLLSGCQADLRSHKTASISCPSGTAIHCKHFVRSFFRNLGWSKIKNGWNGTGSKTDSSKPSFCNPGEVGFCKEKSVWEIDLLLGFDLQFWLQAHICTTNLCKYCATLHRLHRHWCSPQRTSLRAFQKTHCTRKESEELHLSPASH